MRADGSRRASRHVQRIRRRGPRGAGGTAPVSRRGSGRRGGRPARGHRDHRDDGKDVARALRASQAPRWPAARVPRRRQHGARVADRLRPCARSAAAACLRARRRRRRGDAPGWARGDRRARTGEPLPRALQQSRTRVGRRSTDTDAPAGLPTAGACRRLHVGAGSADRLDAIPGQVEALCRQDGPAFLEIRIRQGSRPDLGRPEEPPSENRRQFTAWLAR